MRIFLTILAVSAYIAHAVDVDNKHYSQHRTSVDAAKQGLNERLSKLEQQNAYQRQYGANENYVAGCTSGCSTGSSSALSSRSSQSSLSSQRSSANALDNSDYVGVGIVSHGYGNDESELQERLSSRFTAGSAYEADDLQQRQVPGDLSNIQSSAYRQAASSRQSQASRSSYREEEEEEEEDLQRNIGAGYHDLSVNNDRYVESQSQRRAQQSQRESETRITSGGRPVTVYVPGGSTVTSSRSSSGSNSESQLTETRTQRPVAVGQYVSMAVRPGTSTVLTIPVAAQDQSQQRVYSSSNRRDYQAGAESSRTRVQPGYQFNYYPSYSSSDRTASSTGSRSDSVTSRTSTYQQPERISSTNTRYNEREVEEEEDEEETQQRISPANTGGSRYTSTSGGSTNYQQGYTSSSRLVPVAPIHTVESTSSQRTAAEEREQRRYSQARPTYSQRTSANRNENEQASSSSSQQTTVNRPVYSASRTANTEGSQYGSSGTTYYTVPAPSQSRINLQSQSQQGSSSQSQYQAGSGSQSQYVSGSGSRGGYQSYPTYSRTTGSQSQRGSSAGAVNQRFNSHTMSTGSDNLLDYMSESERLAKAQQSQVIGTQASTSSSAAEANRRTVNTASNLDAAAASFVSSSNLANRFNEFDNVENLGGAGGFKRVKSWQKQSKWASGSEYGTDGQPKSYSMLSTGESEKHNINGAETGYKAATTTLENDGKVSTYSIHTP